MPGLQDGTYISCEDPVAELVDVEDIDTTAEDHIYDEVRYIAMANPINPPKRECPVKIYNPLEEDSYGEYNFFR